MKRTLKIILRSLSGIIIFLIMLPIVVSIVLQIDFVQNFAVRKATEILSKVAGTEISISSVGLDFFTSARFGDIYIEDNRGDTLLYAKSLRVSIDHINFLSGEISLGTTILEEPQLNLYTDSLGLSNLNEVFKNFASQTPNPNPPNFVLSADRLRIENGSFNMDNYGVESTEGVVNFGNLALSGIELDLSDISVYNHNIWLELDNLAFKDKSGFSVERLASPHCGVDSSGLYFTELELKTAHSDLKLDSLNLLTANSKWTDWMYFADSMVFSASIKNSKLSTQTLSHLAGAEFYQNRDIEIGAVQVNGPLNKIKGRLTAIEYANNRVMANFDIKDLSDIRKTYFDIDITSLRTNAAAIEDIVYATSGGELPDGDSTLIANLDDIEFKFDFRGGFDRFSSNLTISSSSRGEILSHFDMVRGDSNGVMLVGRLSTTEFGLGQTLGVKDMGETSLAGGFSLSATRGRPIVFDADFNVSKLLFGGYEYHDIIVDGAISSRQFNGLISSNDPNMQFEVNGLFDYSTEIPMYNLTADLKRANLYAIGVNKRDSVSLLTAKFTAEGSGTSIDDFNGWGKIDKIYYINTEDTVSTAAIDINAVAETEFREIKIYSQFADVVLRGRHSFLEIPQYLSSSLERFIPTYEYINEELLSSDAQLASNERKFLFSDGYYQLNMQIKEANNVAFAIFPSLEISSGTSVNFFFNPYLDQFILRAKSDYITSNDFLVEKLNIDSRNIGDSLSLSTTSSLIAIGDTYFPDFSMEGGIKENVINLGAEFKDKRNAAEINTTTRFARLDSGLPQLQVEFHPTDIMVDSMEWSIAESRVTLDTIEVNIENFSIFSKDERLVINGTAGRTTSDTVNIALTNANLAPASYFIESLGYDIKGNADGHVDLISALKNPIMFAQVDLRGLELSGYKIGDAQVLSSMDDTKNSIDFEIVGSNGFKPIYGGYDIKGRELILDIEFPRLPLSLLDPMLSGILYGSSGDADTDLRLTIGGGDVSLDGTINFDEFATSIDFTQTRYRILDGKIRVENSSFYLPQTKLVDSERGEGTIQADFTTVNFGQMAYDVDVEFENLLALNTTIEDNSSFFGKAYGTGRVDIDGNDRLTTLNIAAETAGNSSITMPLSGASNIEEATFIRFVKPKSDTTEVRNVRRSYRRKTRVKHSSSEMEIDIKMNIDVLPNTLAQIELDAKVGDVIKARGEGQILMHINPTLDIFSMSGPVTVTEGNYLFTLQTIINKRFILEPGGTITWSGDATDPDIDLTALYKLKTSLMPLTGDINDKAKTNIDCGIILTGKLMTPTIEFDITAPTADAETQNALRNSLNTEEALSMQFLSLMLANSFMPDMGTASIGTMGSSVAGVTGAEFLSNQLSNLISNERFDIRVGYNPKSDISSDEFSAGIGTEIIDDVLSFEVDGNYDTGNNASSYSQNPFSVDAYLTWNINRKGTLKLKGFTRTIDRFDETQGMQESGVGVYFTQDFNNFRDLVRRLNSTFRSDSIANAKEREIRRKEREELLRLREQRREERKQKSEATVRKEEEED